MRLRALAVLLAVLASPLAAQQDQSLADIRQELSVLYVEIQQLKQELNTNGAPQGVSGDTMLDRITGIELELQRMIAKTENLEFRIRRIVEDGTTRIGDLEFRLVELEGGDLATLGETSTLGGDVPSAPAVPVDVQPETGGLALNEDGDFARAKAALEGLDYATAADQFGAFVATYPGGPLTLDAMYHQGEAHEGLGEMRAAARSYLNAFSANPVGARAPEALFRLGRSLGALGQMQEACITLAEVGVRFPGGKPAADADQARANMGCS